MILPIVAYGAAILRKKSMDITPDYPGLQKLIEDMWETMYASNGVGLAAPQVNKDIRLFVMDSKQIFEHMEDDEKGCMPMSPGLKKFSLMRIFNRSMVKNGPIMKDASVFPISGKTSTGRRK